MNHRTYFDDNYGSWNEPDCEDDIIEQSKFIEWVKKDSIEKTCSLCGNKVILRKEYDKCNSCMEILERGMEW